jgi:hypothetical protein
MGLVLSVEIFAGTSEDVAALEIATLATTLNLTVEASHNGVTMRAAPRQTPEHVLADFKRECRLQNYPQS